MKKWIFAAIAALVPWFAAYPFDPPGATTGLAMMLSALAIYPAVLILAVLVATAGVRFVSFLVALLGYPAATFSAYFGVGLWLTPEPYEQYGIGAAFFVAFSILFGLVALGIFKIFSISATAAENERATNV